MGRSITTEYVYKANHNVLKPKFRVPIIPAAISSSKIKAIAEYKLKKIQKSSEVISKGNNSMKIEAGISEISMKSDIVKGSASVSATAKDGRNPPNKLNISNENIKKELDNLHKTSASIKKEMLSLAIIRNSLLWLLRRTTLNETTRNHLHS